MKDLVAVMAPAMSYRWKINFGAESVLSANACNMQYDLIKKELYLELEQPEVLGVDFLNELNAVVSGSGVIVVDLLLGDGRPHTHLVFNGCKPIEHHTELDYGNRHTVKHNLTFEFIGLVPRHPTEPIKPPTKKATKQDKGKDQ